MKSGILAALALLGAILCGAGSLGASETGLPRVAFMPQWMPQAQFAGYYVAYEKGFYRQHGLDVSIRRGGPASSPPDALARGQVDFTTMFLSIGIENRARGLKLVNLAQIVQRSAMMLVAKKTSGIKVPADMHGKRVGLWRHEFQLQPQEFFRTYRVQVRVIPQSATLNLFLQGGVEVASAMYYNEYHLLLNAGLNPDELTTFLLADYGLNYPEDCIYCLEKTFRRYPEHCRGFVAASIEGWRYAFAHPEEALDIVMRYAMEAHVATNRVHQKWMLAKMQDLIAPPGDDRPLGTLRQTDYERVAHGLLTSGLITAAPAYAAFYRNCAASHDSLAK